MASIINASTSAGLVQTADTSGILKLQTNGTDGVTVDASQNVTLNGTIRMAAYTVSTLPAAGTAGRRAYVTNALTPVSLSAVVGGGAITVPVFDNGTTWIVG